MKKVGGPKAERPKRVRNCDVIHVIGITSIMVQFNIIGGGGGGGGNRSVGVTSCGKH